MFNFKVLKNKKVSIAVIIILAVLLVVLIFVLNILFWQKTKKEFLFTVNSGVGTREIASNLQQEKIIPSSLAFSGYVYLNRWFLQNGVYKIGKGMNTAKIAELIHSGKVQEYIVTIPEGWRVTQIDDLLTKKGIIKKGEFAKVASTKEGYLFPDTYRLPVDGSAQSIMNIMLANFQKKTSDSKIDLRTITVASIVEREARADVDRPKIAGVYLNRLRIGMKLDSDPTIQYGKGDWSSITKADYKNFQSPYNTYLHNGLPPTPICNPGFESIRAVLNPEKHDYLFFFSTKDGQTIYSKTYDEHLKNLQKY
jgi:UPF0755 protein